MKKSYYVIAIIIIAALIGLAIWANKKVTIPGISSVDEDEEPNEVGATVPSSPTTNKPSVLQNTPSIPVNRG